MQNNTRKRVNVLDAPIDVLDWDTALSRMATWSLKRESRYVCLCNVHSIVTARQSAQFSKVIAGADMAAPDGAPVAAMLRLFGYSGQQRINGPDLMWKYCHEAAKIGASIFLYGGRPETLTLLKSRLTATFPDLKIVGAYSPPFRPATPEEDKAEVELINASGATTVWVSLGCPKQEYWISEHCGRINAVMIGVGAAFDYHAGTLRRAPLWMRNIGLEWLYRLILEPRRLWKRYLFTNTIFLGAVCSQILSGKSGFYNRNKTPTDV